MATNRADPAFPLTRAKACKVYVAGMDPLDILHPHEIRAAELFAFAWLEDPDSRSKPQRMQGPGWPAAFLREFGVELTQSRRRGMELNPAWQAYVRQLKQQTRETVLAKLKATAHRAFDNFIHAQEAARTADDYKELRLAASDHLDRIGATEKPEQVAQNVVVVLKGRTFTEDTLGRELPAIEAEVVTNG